EEDERAGVRRELAVAERRLRLAELAAEDERLRAGAARLGGPPQAAHLDLAAELAVAGREAPRHAEELLGLLRAAQPREALPELEVGPPEVRALLEERGEDARGIRRPLLLEDRDPQLEAHLVAVLRVVDGPLEELL